MTTAATQYPLVGSQPIGNFFAPDTTQRHPLGATIDFNDPYWGGGRAIYLQMPTSTALKVGTIMVWDTATSFVASAIANTANLGKSLGFLRDAVASNAAAQYAWVQIAGQALCYSTASVAADTALGITAAGQAGANSAGKEILSCRVTAPATTTVVKTANVVSGSPKITLSKGVTDGWFVGMPISGTGIPASTTVSSIDPNNRDVVLSANATASGFGISVTGTYNDGTAYWNVVTCNAPFAQGAIT